MSARLLVPALMVWLAALGLVRRLLTELVEPTTFDLLLLVGPSVVIALLIATRSFRGGPVGKSRLTILVTVLGVLAVAAALNPLNGSPVAGVAGLLFVLIPLLAYWIGMRIDETTLKESLFIVGGLSLVAAAYGLYQSLGGFPSWDQHWIETSGYAALNVGGEIRAFSSFSSASEYAVYVAVGLIMVSAFLFGRARFLPVMLPARRPARHSPRPRVRARDHLQAGRGARPDGRGPSEACAFRPLSPSHSPWCWSSRSPCQDRAGELRQRNWHRPPGGWTRGPDERGDVHARTPRLDRRRRPGPVVWRTRSAQVCRR